ncbi:uncharacterized protein LOC143206768 isoform X2 [Rhynchophorus ferrugineus]|uniref:uncharacterized protein LOC143206768 isoform X2 n=1 Tax=Rhynchophorus ferrugineus TaxID=354439 RepID=UPI003FCD0875
MAIKYFCTCTVISKCHEYYMLRSIQHVLARTRFQNAGTKQNEQTTSTVLWKPDKQIGISWKVSFLPTRV